MNMLSAEVETVEQLPGLPLPATSRTLEAELLEALDAIVWVADPALRRMSYVNAGAASFLGYPISRWLHEDCFWSWLQQDDEREVTLATCDAVAADGVARRFVHRVHDVTGAERWFATTVRPVPAGAQPPRALAGTMVDLTERSQVEQQLSQTEARQRLLLEQIPAIVWTTDRALRFTTGVGAGLSRLGLRPDVLVGRTMYEYFQTEDQSHPNIEPNLRALATGRSTRFVANWLGRDFDVYVEPFRDEQGVAVGTLGIALDVTDRARAERERADLLRRERAARQDAERAVQMRDEFFSIASHELYTPLTSLRIAIERLERAPGVFDQPLLAKSVRIAEEQVERMIHLVGQLLDVSRIHSGRLPLDVEELDLALLARDVAVRFMPLLEQAGCAVELVIDQAVVGAWDRGRLEQVVTNLLSNALKYAAGSPVRIAVDVAGRAARLVVADRGCGIPADRLSSVFERFERGANLSRVEGLGLGLYIARSIVQAHGGTITVESQAGEGAAFTVTLPLPR